MRDFKELRVWQHAHELVLNVYKVTNNFPKTEVYSLTSQIRRAATSIPSNIAEGSHRSTDLDFKRFLYIAIASAGELEYQLILAKDLNYLSEENFKKLTEELLPVKRMLNSFIQTLKG